MEKLLILQVTSEDKKESYTEKTHQKNKYEILAGKLKNPVMKKYETVKVDGNGGDFKDEIRQGCTEVYVNEVVVDASVVAAADTSPEGTYLHNNSMPPLSFFSKTMLLIYIQYQ